MTNEFRMYVGPMFGGKTTRMLSAVDRYKYQGQKILAFKPQVDERYSKESIVTHWGHELNANRILDGAALKRKVIQQAQKNPCVIAVDEVFMIPGCGNVLVELFKQGNTILISSLQLSSDGSPYPEVACMFPYATYVEVCAAVDPISKRDAYYTEKYGGRKDHAIEVGGAEMYRPRDWAGFFGVLLPDQHN